MRSRKTLASFERMAMVEHCRSFGVARTWLRTLTGNRVLLDMSAYVILSAFSFRLRQPLERMVTDGRKCHSSKYVRSAHGPVHAEALGRDARRWRRCRQTQVAIDVHAHEPDYFVVPIRAIQGALRWMLSIAVMSGSAKGLPEVLVILWMLAEWITGCSWAQLWGSARRPDAGGVGSRRFGSARASADAGADERTVTLGLMSRCGVTGGDIGSRFFETGFLRECRSRVLLQSHGEESRWCQIGDRRTCFFRKGDGRRFIDWIPASGLGCCSALR